MSTSPNQGNQCPTQPHGPCAPGSQQGHGHGPAHGQSHGKGHGKGHVHGHRHKQGHRHAHCHKKGKDCHGSSSTSCSSDSD